MLPENTILQGRYKIVEPIGRGGMGAVYKALDMRLRSVVALKQTLLTGEIVRKAFEREAQLLAGLRHPALPKVSDHFTEDAGQFLVMEYIAGNDLGKLITDRAAPFPVDDVLRWADVLLDALEYLHGHTPPIVHRDIKPQNMKLTDRGEVILLDFGLAKGVVAQATRPATTSSIFGYTPHYAPLEQIQGSGTDPRSDQYALAATLYHLLTATQPPDALTRAAARINEDPDPLVPANQLNPQISAPVATVLARAMSQKPDQRYVSALALRAALRSAAQGAAPTVTLADAATPAPDPDTTMVRVATAETVAARSLHMPAPPATGDTAVQPATGTTVTPVAAQPTTRRPAWLLPVLGGAIGALAVAAMLFLRAPGEGAPPPPTLNPNTAVVYAIEAEPEATATAQPTAAGLTNAELLETAAVLQTAEAQQRAEDLATARVLVNATDGAATQTAVALTPTATALPATETPVVASATSPPATEVPAATTAPATSAPRPTSLPRPTSTPQPTSVPAPSVTPDAPDPVILDSGSGRLFRGSASLGETDPARGNGGSCIEGRVTQADGAPFSRLGVQVDFRGNTRQPAVNADGVYALCGLGAGEWGISIYQAGGLDIPGDEQVAHQVRVQLTGTPGEIVYVNFRATESFVAPTAVPTAVASPYDGVWRGSNSGTTTTGEYPPGRFEIEVRAGAVYRISVDGPSCPFETYPNYPAGVAINGAAFRVAGAVFNPIAGANNGHVVTISGSFASESQASGTLNAQLNGAPCADGSWNARK
jgi:eukaryotic-like serine/threonine-protein kinase